MFKEKTILAVIPARGGSKRIPKKNIKKLGGKPLIAYTIDAAVKSELLDDFIVSTDDKEIKEIAMSFGARVIDRPQKISQDNSKVVDVILHILSREKADIVVLLQPTSPFRTFRDIDNAISIFLHNKCDSVISCSVAGPNGAVYVSTPKNLFQNKTFYAGKVIIYSMPPERSIDIDTKEDWVSAEKLLK